MYSLKILIRDESLGPAIVRSHGIDTQTPNYVLEFNYFSRDNLSRRHIRFSPSYYSLVFVSYIE